MKNINNYTEVGRLTRDMEVSYTNSGYAIGKFGLAYTRSVKKDGTWQDKSCFIDCTLFGKRAEALLPYMTKGLEVTICGEIDHETWEKDGQKRSKHSVIVNEINMHGGGKKQEDTGGNFEAPKPPEGNQAASSDEIPF